MALKIYLNASYSIIPKIKKGMWVSFVSILLLLILYVFSVRINLFNLFGGMPSYRSLENPEDKNDLSSRLFTVDGKLLGKYFRYNRTQVTYEDLSPELIKTLLCTEDVRFYDHAGIDPRSVLRVGVYTILLGQRSAGGGSTISQQLAKNLFDTREKEFDGLIQELGISKLNLAISKTKEWILAIQLERSFTKNEIMAMFLNTVFFGEHTYGIEVASKTFFNTTPDKLNYQQSATLVGMLNQPTTFNPVRNPENSLNKRNRVLYNLVQYDSISRDMYDSLKTLPLGLKFTPEGHNEGPAPYFRSYIRPFLINWAKENGYDLFEAGLKIYTTIDSRMQKYAEKAVDKHMANLQKTFDEHWKGRNPWIDENGNEITDFVDSRIKNTQHYRSLTKKYGKKSDSVSIILNTPYEMDVFSWDGEKEQMMSPVDSLKYYKKILQAGFMTMDPNTGHIKAWVGGINHKYFKYDHVKQGHRQPGSTFKPIVYTVAIDQGYPPCYEVQDVPVNFILPDKSIYTPNNFNNNFSGEKMTMRQGMARSVNSIAAYIFKQVTAEKVIKYARDLGIENPLDPVPSLCLGTSDVSVYELAGAYSTFANRGVYTKPYFITRIEDKYGNVLQEFYPETREVLSEETAFLMLYMLMGATEETGGTARGLSLEVREGNEIGAKTGTTQNASDGWFMGVTKDLVSGVWVGGDERSIHFRGTTLGQGSKMALPVWDYFMQQVYADKTIGIEKRRFDRPMRGLDVELDCNRYKLFGDQNLLDSLAKDDSPSEKILKDNIY